MYLVDLFWVYSPPPNLYNVDQLLANIQAECRNITGVEKARSKYMEDRILFR